MATAPVPVAMAMPGMAVPVGPGMYPPAMMAAPVPMAMPGCGATGMAHLQTMGQVDVQERANLLQEATALLGAEIEMANKYRILDHVGNQMYYAVERTDCCRRQMQNSCCHDCASWEVDVLYTPPGALSQHFLALRRPCQLTCCCLNRPTADVVDTAGPAQQKIGSFRDPCTCCNLRFEVRDAADNDVLVVNGGCCCLQPGLWCPLPCGPCAQVSFSVEDANTGNEVATISKRVPGCLSWCLAPDVDNYHVIFDQVHNPQWKAILLAFTIFLDFRYFNVNRNEENAQNARQAARAD